MIRREIKPELKHTWETLGKLVEGYQDALLKSTNPDMEIILEYFLNMNEYERYILVLYSEYESYRKVADETYCSHQMIKLIMSVIRQDIAKLKKV